MSKKKETEITESLEDIVFMPAFLSLPFAELHTPLFLAGTHLGTKLIPAGKKGLTLQYAWAEKKLLVGWNGKLAIIPDSNIASLTVEDPTVISQLLGTEVVIPKSTYQKPIVVTAGPVPMRQGVAVTAQVSDPSRGMK